MSERLYLFLVGVYILVALYVELDFLIYGLVVLLVFESISDIRLTTLTQRARNISLGPGLVTFHSQQRFNIDATRAWRMLVSVVLVASYFMVYEQGVESIWFFPWFMGFAIMGAGASGVCPMMMTLKLVGFK
jgi:hypothetical protein